MAPRPIFANPQLFYTIVTLDETVCHGDPSAISYVGLHRGDVTKLHGVIKPFSEYSVE